jgi:virginiamycin B lyase
MLLRKGLCFACIMVMTACLLMVSPPAERAFAVSGVTFSEWDLSACQPVNITTGPDGALWFTEYSGNRIGRITTAGEIDEFPLPQPSSFPYGIVAGPDGALWFTEFKGNRIGRITTAGVITEIPLPNLNSGPYGITMSLSGGIYFTEIDGNRIGTVYGNGTIHEWAIPHPDSCPDQITAGPDGAVWFTEQNGNSIGRCDGSGNMDEYDIPTSNSKPHGIAAGSDGNLWFTEWQGGKIGRMTPAGICSEWGLPAGSWPTGMTAGPDGALWFMESQRNRIGHVTTSGEIRSWGLPNAGSDPWGITTGPDGALWFAENFGGRIGKAVIEGSPWYLAEGCTAGDMETWVLVQNPCATAVTVDLTLMTGSGPQSPPGLQGVSIPAESRISFDLGAYVQSWDVSTRVTPTGGDVICERAVYGDGRAWGTDSIGTTTPQATWYLAEGCTAGDFETWVLVQNPNASAATVDLTFMTSAGLVNGPQDVSIPAGSRKSFNAGEYVTDYDVSTRVTSTGGRVVCERSMYGNGRAWAHDSIGVSSPLPMWFLAEGCTAGDFETWVLVQNPNASAVTVDLTLLTGNGAQSPAPLQGVSLPAYSRRSFNLGGYVQSWDVSTEVMALGGSVVCERAVYGNGRTWGTDSIGAAKPGNIWFLAEGCTAGGMETWVLVMNTKSIQVNVDLDFMTSSGVVYGPPYTAIPPLSRVSFNVSEYVEDWDVSTRVYSREGGIVCERAVYGNGRQWAHDSVGYPQ